MLAFNDHLKAEYRRRGGIADPATLGAELHGRSAPRSAGNCPCRPTGTLVGRYEATGYVNLDDDKAGRGPAIRQAGKQGK